MRIRRPQKQIGIHQYSVNTVMKQFVLPANYIFPPDTRDADIRIEGAEYHYLIRVRRVKEGTEFEAVDMAGNRYRACVTDIFPEHAILNVSRHIGGEKSKEPQIVLFQCLPKGKKMDSIIRQATEAGVAEIVPLISDYCISRPDEQGSGGKISRWKKIAIEATQQSGSNNPPKISEILSFRDAIQQKKDLTLGLFFHQEPLENSSLHSYCSNIPYGASDCRIGIVIGPEGGLSQKEIKILQEHGFKPVFLGPRILRTETAPIYAIGAVQTILLERDEWQSANEYHS